jgi:DNA-binding IclR family transcriptional regulator
MQNKGQVVSRVAAVLTAVDRCGLSGARLVDLARETGIARPTVHRILHELCDVGYVRVVDGRRYALGPALYSLGLSAAPPRFDLPSMETILRGLAHETGDTVYLGIRQHYSIRYLLRIDGSYPIRAQIVEVGQIVPLGATFSGIALIATTTDEEIRGLIESQPPIEALKGLPYSNPETRVRILIEQRQQMRERGYCYSRDLVWPGVSGIATAVPSPNGKPLLAVSVSAVNERLPEKRAAEIVPQLLQTAKEIASFAW